MMNFVLVVVLNALTSYVSFLESQSLDSISDASEPDYFADLKSGELELLNSETENVTDKISNFLVLLYYQGEYRCLATLISDRLILTAIQCVKEDGELQNPVFFSARAAGAEESFLKTPIEFISLHVFPDNEDSDMVILVTKKIVDTGDNLERICLSNDMAKESMYYDGVVAAVDTENGLKDTLEFFNVKVVSKSYCGIQGISKLCAYGGNTTLCKGDYGGPLIATNKQNVHFQIGVFLGAAYMGGSIPKEAGCSNLVVYDRVSHYEKFLLEIAKESQSDLCFITL